MIRLARAAAEGREPSRARRRRPGRQTRTGNGCRRGAPVAGGSVAGAGLTEPGVSARFKALQRRHGAVEDREFGTWRSPVAHLNGVQGVAGSNPAVPTVENIVS